MALDEFVRLIGNDVVGSCMYHGAHDEQSGNECGYEQFNFHSSSFSPAFCSAPFMIHRFAR